MNSSTNKEKNIERLTKIFGKEWVRTHPLTLDWDKYPQGNHKSVPIKVCSGQKTIEIDEALAPLLERINKEKLLTISSCQCNLLGYSGISFTDSSFDYWVNSIAEKHCEKYESLNKYNEKSLWCALFHRNGDLYDNHHIGKFTTHVFQNGEKYYISIYMTFHPKYIDTLVKLYDNTFC